MSEQEMPVPTENEVPAQDTPNDLHDPLAYFRAKAHKLERLLEKSQRDVETLQTQLTENAHLAARLQEVEAAAQDARQAADRERIQRLRSEAVSSAGLPPEAIRFINAEDVAGIQTEIQSLLSLVPTPRGRIGNASGAGGRAQQLYERASGMGSGSGWDAIRGE